MLQGFMTALQVILLQLTLPRDQRAKSDLFQSTWKLCCRDSHKTQVWLCFFTLSLLTSCVSATPIKVHDLQICLQKDLKDTIKISDAKLYAPKAEDMTHSCQQKVLSCYMLELMMVLEEEETELSKTQCVYNFYSKLTPERNCPACEIYSLVNSTVFYNRLSNILQKINAFNARK